MPGAGVKGCDVEAVGNRGERGAVVAVSTASISSNVKVGPNKYQNPCLMNAPPSPRPQDWFKSS
jgi:hypothetical protein